MFFITPVRGRVQLRVTARAVLYTALVRPEIAQRIDAILPRHHERPEIQLLYRMMRDYPERGGKGIRSELLLMTGDAFGANRERALWLAAAVELFQNWVLIHDDIEDDSEERRGRPALHREHGIPLAINAGDALHVYMWGAVFQANVPGANEEVLRMIHRTAEGQHVDLTWVAQQRWDVTTSDYLDMVRLKTGYYTVVSPLRLGLLAADLTPDERLEEAGLKLGAAFQIRDDVLNLIADSRQYGKEIAGDLLEGKRTLLVLRWLEQASAGQRSVFLNEMARTRAEKDPRVIAQILEWILQSDAVEYAMHVAHEHARQGLQIVRSVLAQAPDEQSARSIVRLLEQLATREA